MTFVKANVYCCNGYGVRFVESGWYDLTEYQINCISQAIQAQKERDSGK